MGSLPFWNRSLENVLHYELNANLEISLTFFKFVNMLTMLLHAAIYYIQQVYNKDAHEYILSIELEQTRGCNKLFINTYYQVMYFRLIKADLMMILIIHWNRHF